MSAYSFTLMKIASLHWRENMYRLNSHMHKHFLYTETAQPSESWSHHWSYHGLPLLKLAVSRISGKARRYSKQSTVKLLIVRYYATNDKKKKNGGVWMDFELV